MTNRWEAFTDKELDLLATRIDYYANVHLDEYPKVGKEIFAEVDRRYRSASQRVYRGPGVYLDMTTGMTLNVLRSVKMRGQIYLLIGKDNLDPDMDAIPASDLEGVDKYGKPFYRYERES
jgi:hypothetical protein